MSEIKAGDLVMVVRGLPCCNRTNTYGHTFTVSRVEDWFGQWECRYCSATLNKARLVFRADRQFGYFPEMLKRIDPPALDETTDTYEELTI